MNTSSFEGAKLEKMLNRKNDIYHFILPVIIRTFMSTIADVIDLLEDGKLQLYNIIK